MMALTSRHGSTRKRASWPLLSSSSIILTHQPSLFRQYLFATSVPSTPTGHGIAATSAKTILDILTFAELVSRPI